MSVQNCLKYTFFNLFIDSCVSLVCFIQAALKRSQGLRFDIYGRMLGFASLGRIARGSTVELLLNPVSALRYSEFEFAGKSLALLKPGKLIDVSSPGLFLIWAAEKLNIDITAVNPDSRDIKRTRELSGIIGRGKRISFLDSVFAQQLPFADNTFDALTSISVVEHLNNDADIKAMDEFVRIVKPGGWIIITFPVKPELDEEFRDVDPYGLQEKPSQTRGCFFQRFYDESSINERLVGKRPVKVSQKQYFYEREPGCFNKYIAGWRSLGLKLTVKDPILSTRLFLGPFENHPKDRMANCNLLLEVSKSN